MSHAGAEHVAIVVAVALVAIGVLGFVPGLTTHYEQLAFAGPLNAPDNRLHLAIGVCLLGLGHVTAQPSQRVEV